MAAKAHQPHGYRVGIIGWPVAHSVSPAMHNAAFETLGMNWRYELLPTPPEAIEQRVAELRAPEFAGANVTIPHKQAVIPHLDEVVDAAAVVGAVNTIVSDGNRLIGHNTDVAGIRWALAHNHVQLAGWHVVVLGAGGAARAALYTLHTLGVASISVFNRTLERAESLIDDLGPNLEDISPSTGSFVRLRRDLRTGLEAAPLANVGRLEATLARADLLVNATSSGMHPDIDESPLPDGVALPAHVVVFDMVYNPLKTRLLQQAELQGSRTIRGLDMLIGQGVEAFRLWTGRAPPVDLMRQAALGSLETA